MGGTNAQRVREVTHAKSDHSTFGASNLALLTSSALGYFAAARRRIAPSDARLRVGADGVACVPAAGALGLAGPSVGITS